MKIGFTGSRHGMTLGQRSELADLLRRLGATELHHGDCVGADEQAHHVAVALGLQTVAHPPIKRTLRAFCKADEVREPKDYLARDQDIVDETERLIATPRSPRASKGSGTWYTVSYAERNQRMVAVLEPHRWLEPWQLMI